MLIILIKIKSSIWEIFKRSKQPVITKWWMRLLTSTVFHKDAKVKNSVLNHINTRLRGGNARTVPWLGRGQIANHSTTIHHRLRASLCHPFQELWPWLNQRKPDVSPWPQGCQTVANEARFLQFYDSRTRVSHVRTAPKVLLGLVHPETCLV